MHVSFLKIAIYATKTQGNHFLTLFLYNFLAINKVSVLNISLLKISSYLYKIYIRFLILGVKLSAGLTDTFYKKIKEWRRLTCV